jgi:hypothetical protein
MCTVYVFFVCFLCLLIVMFCHLPYISKIMLILGQFHSQPQPQTNTIVSTKYTNLSSVVTCFIFNSHLLCIFGLLL